MVGKLDTPRVGIQVLVVKKGKVLIGRDDKKGKDVYGVPAGHWESNETLKEGAIREVKEESGIICNKLKLISVYDFFRKDKGVRYVSIGYVAQYVGGQLKNNLEEKRLDWSWVNPKKALKFNLYPAGRVLVEKFLSLPEKFTFH